MSPEFFMCIFASTYLICDGRWGAEIERHNYCLIRRVSNLPEQSDSGAVKYLILQRSPFATPIADVELNGIWFGAFRNIEHFSVRSSKLSFRSFLRFEAMPPRLAFLSIEDCDVGNEYVARLLSRQPKLHTLWLSNVPVSDTVITEIAKLDQLQSLKLATRTIAGDRINDLSLLRGLIHLDFSGASLKKESFAKIGLSRNLLILGLDKTTFSDEDVSSLGPLRLLRHLSIRHTRVSNDGLAALVSAHPSLKTINIGGTKVTDGGIKAIVERVRTLKIEN